MKKRLALSLACLLAVGSTAMAGTSFQSEVRYIQQNDSTNKYEITVANGKTAITENIDFRFDLDRDIYLDSNDDKYQEGYDSDWGFNFKNLATFNALGYEWNTGLVVEYDWDTKKLSETDIKPFTAGDKHNDDEKTTNSGWEFKPYFTTNVGDWGVRISPEFYYDVINSGDNNYQVLDFQAASALANDWTFFTEVYNIINKNGETYQMDLEIYIGKSWSTPVENLNVHFEFGSENYGMFTDATAATDIYGTLRTDYSIQAGPSTIVPYVAVTRYEGNSYGVDYSYSEFGVEVNTKF